MDAHIRRLALISMLAMFAGGYAVGCAGTQNTSEEEVEAQPPEEPPPDDVPEGPEVKVRSDYPEGASEGDTSGGETTGAGTTAEAGDDGESESEAETITDAEREALLEMGPAYVFQAVTLEPMRRDGEFRGYEIVEATAKARDAIQPQLEVGDVVTHVNDIRIERPSDYMDAWDEFGDRDRVEIDLLRDGEEQTAVWVIRSDN